MKIIFLGTSNFALPALKKLHENNYEIPLVLTKKDSISKRGNKLIPSEIKKTALDLGLNVENPNKDELLKAISKYLPIDLIVTAAYGLIIPEKVLILPKFGAINIHASLLPKLRGAAPIQRAILNGDEKTGVSLMLMDAGLDTGDILMREEVDIKDEYFSDLNRKLASIGSDLLILLLEKINTTNGEIINKIKIKQNPDLATYAKPIEKIEGLIDFNLSAKKNVLRVRALSENPGTYFNYKSQKIKINEAEKINGKIKNRINGQILKVSKNEVLINSNGEIFSINELTIPGKRKTKIEDYLKGNPIFIENDIIYL
ncbi:MAG: methionyl-tRNA formyltransferase [Clostridiales Family XIII bacterium]|jgi:methionyl-tRNA formyltransferase|nr:methionyl-tRNA formyltransferase [Clostridiales Family XIII bacterium]